MTNYDYNLYNHFHSQMDRLSNKVLLTTENDKSFRYADIIFQSSQLANYLISQGAQPGDRISAQVGKSPESFCLYLACLAAGLVYHPLNPAYSIHELEYFLDNAEPKIIVCDSEKFQQIKTLAESLDIQNVETLDDNGTGSLIANSTACSGEFKSVKRAENDLAALLYSSGTTGVPKGIMLTHGNLLSNAKSLMNIWGFTEQDRLLHCLPTFHVHGLFISLGCVLLSGASMRWLSAFKTDQVMRYMPECTVMMGVPTYYSRLLEDAEFCDKITTNIRLFISGSAPLKEETFHLFEQRTGHSILERYGMTETNINTSNPLQGERKSGTVGLPVPNVDIQIVDDNDNALAVGEIGNIKVRGPNVFIGYWRLPDKTKESFNADHFFDTGDKGQITDDGYLSIVGRSKDLIISGGLNIYPKEVEILLDDLSGVKESAVIGVPHSDFGEAVVAIIIERQQGQLKEAEIITTMKEKVANFKVPKKVMFMDELPRNTMGKVQKNILRDQYNDLLS